MSAVLSSTKFASTPDVKVVTMTPEMAERYLSKNTINRPFNEKYALALSRQMAAGAWKLNMETIKVASDGTLVDGQHRLNAVITAGVPVEMAVAYGVPKETFDTIDTGRRRSGADVLSLRGVGGNASIVAAGCRMGIAIEATQRGENFNGVRSRTTNADVVAYFDRNPQIVDVVPLAAGVKSIFRRQGEMLGVVHVLSKVDAPFTAEFFRTFGDGIGLYAGHPVLALRRVLINFVTRGVATTPETMAALVIKAWNYQKDGKRMELARYNAEEYFPEIRGWRG